MTMKTPDIYEGGPGAIKIALCQVLTEPWAVEENAARCLAAIDDAARQGAELAILPECALHGYGPNCEGFAGKMLAIAERVDGARILEFRRKAREAGIHVCLGFAERGEGEDIHNSAIVISRAGDVLAVYRKVHCRNFESIEHDGRFVPGREFFVVDLPCAAGTFKVGVMICFDREVAESVRCLRALGAQFIACPLATNTDDLRAFHPHADNEMITRVRAAENELFIAVVNHAGRFNGGSFIVGPGGETLAQMGAGPGIHVESVPVGAVPRSFHNNTLGWMGWGYRRPEVYSRYLAGA